MLHLAVISKRVQFFFNLLLALLTVYHLGKAVTSGQEVIVCPFCGAPYAGIVPHDVVHVKCKYCGGVILLPSHLSVVPRCPNHPDTVAVGLCSRCFRGVCKKCLYLHQVEGGRTYLCPTCTQARQTDQAWISIGMGAVISLFALLISAASFLLGVLFILIFSLPFIAYGLYILKRPLESFAPTVQEIEEGREARKEEGMISANAEFLYWKLWREYVRTMGVAGITILEKRIHDYMNQGLSKEEAIKKLSKIEKIY